MTRLLFVGIYSYSAQSHAVGYYYVSVLNKEIEEQKEEDIASRYDGDLGSRVRDHDLTLEKAKGDERALYKDGQAMYGYKRTKHSHGISVYGHVYLLYTYASC